MLSAIYNWFNRLGKTYITPTAYLQSGGRDEIVYVDGDHQMRINCELQTGKVERIIYTLSLNRWQPPFDTEDVPEAEKN